MGRVRITLVAAVLGGAAWVTGVGSAVNATPCAKVASANSTIQRGAHDAGADLRRDVHGDLNGLGGDLSRALDGPVHKLVTQVCT